MKEMIRKLFRVLPDGIYIQLMYFYHFGRLANLRNPKTFNEKLQWLKLHDRKSQNTIMVDKYLVKDYVSRKIGEEYIIPTYGVWDKPEDIDFEILPKQFVLKWNHDSGSIVICKDKETFDKAAAIEKLKYGVHNTGYWYSREWPYKNVKPKIIAEKYMLDEHQKDTGLIDYKFYCFNGKAKCLYVSRGLGESHKYAELSFFDLDWNIMPFKRDDFKPLSKIPPRPLNFEQMIELAEKLSSDHDFLRVDFYEVNKHIYFSELTFYPCGGFMKFNPREWDLEMGMYLELTK